MVEEARKRREAAAAAASAPPAPVEVPETSNKPPTISSQDLTLSLQLPPSSTLSQAELEATLGGKYGALAHVILAPGKAKEGKKARGSRAIVEFAPGNWGGCWACLHDHAGIDGAKAKWASGEPAWVKWAESLNSRPAANGAGGEGGGGGGAGFASAPDFSSGAADNTHRKWEEERAENAAIESATLLRMRQRERERLAEEIRRREAEDE